MATFLDLFNQVTASINFILWHPIVLYLLTGLGLLFTIRSGFVQYRALTHGTAVVMGKYDDEHGGDGSISHFQALSAALSATVGVGNIGGVALGIALGGPGAVLWMWVVGALGMAIKSVEVTLSMLYRRGDDQGETHGGPMWVAEYGLPERYPSLAWLGKPVGVIFCVTLLISTFVGGLFFQAWNAGNVTSQVAGVPSIAVGIVLAVLVGMVILGGINRIGKVAGQIVPVMCGLYLLAALYVVLIKIELIPEMLTLIVQSAFSGAEARGAFLGGTAGWAFSAGLQRAFFSNEAGQGSSSIAHAAAKTDQPVREGLVAGLEPFIDTLVVCTLTAMVILMSGSWEREPDVRFEHELRFSRNGDGWQAQPLLLPENLSDRWQDGQSVFTRVRADQHENHGSDLHRLDGLVRKGDGQSVIHWTTLEAEARPQQVDQGFYVNYDGAALTAFSFDLIQPGLGSWLVTIATWLFALSTMISWCYYGEQGVIYLVGKKGVLPYKMLFCLAIILSTAGLVRTTTELNNLSNLGTGAMLFVNVPLMFLLNGVAIRAQRKYLKEMKEKDEQQVTRLKKAS